MPGHVLRPVRGFQATTSYEVEVTWKSN
jgi:hypothetical protein